MSRRRFTRSLALAAALAPLGGCSPQFFRTPKLLHPGPAPVQRYNATQFDPYPLPDLGPEIVGGRPPDYIVPVPEVERANQFRDQALARSVPLVMPQPPVGVPAFPTTPVSMPTYPPAGSTIPPVEYRY